MSCEWKKVKGTGWDEPEIYRCMYSRCEDVNPSCPREECCELCGCDCEVEEDGGFEYSPETSGTGTYYGSEEKGGT